MSDWQNSPTMQAAAFEGISENQAYPMADRLKAAQQAIALLRGHIENLEARLGEGEEQQ